MSQHGNGHSFDFSRSAHSKSSSGTTATWSPNWALSSNAFGRVFNGAQQSASTWSEPGAMTSTTAAWFSPPTCIAESSSAFWVSCELPGVSEKDVQVIWQNGVLTIRGQKHEAQWDDNCQMWANDRCFGNFYRSIQLEPFAAWIDSSKVSTRWNNGTLEVTLPKLANASEGFVKVAPRK